MPSAPISIGALASQGSLAAIRASGTQGVPEVATIMRVRGAEIDRAVLEVDDDPVEARTGHDLHGLNAGNGRDRAEGRASLPPLLAQTVERRGFCGVKFETPEVRRIQLMKRHHKEKSRHHRWRLF